MKLQLTYKTVFVLFFLGLTLTVFSQERNRILFVFDASNSMNGYWDKERKINTATRLLSESLDKLAHSENVELGLRVYGHQTTHVKGEQDCEDTELVVKISTGTNLIIKQELKKIVPRGTTPIARSLELAAGDFDDCDNCRNIIILITDGIEACDGDPCAVSRALQAKNVVLKPFIIGIGIEELYASNLECVGNFFDATNEEIFEDILEIVISQALNNTSAQVSLLNAEDEPVETNIPITIYDQDKGEILYNFVQTMNNAGLPDTIALDPLLNYKVVAHTYPEVVKENVKIQAGEHNVIDLKTPQGTLSIVQKSKMDFRENIPCIVRKKGSCDIVKIQNYGTEERFLAGTYDLEFLTTPKTIIKDVEITANETYKIELPKPGTLYINAGDGYGGIYRIEDGIEEQVIRFTYGEIDNRYQIQPGNYYAIFRGKQSTNTLYTFKKEFTIKSGESTHVSF